MTIRSLADAADVDSAVCPACEPGQQVAVVQLFRCLANGQAAWLAGRVSAADPARQLLRNRAHMRTRRRSVGSRSANGLAGERADGRDASDTK
jgi:hypothetical protein